MMQNMTEWELCKPGRLSILNSSSDCLHFTSWVGQAN